MNHFLFLVVIFFLDSGFGDSIFIINQKKECRIKMEFSILKPTLENIEAELIIENSSRGLAFYCEIKNAPPGKYQLALTDLNFKNFKLLPDDNDIKDHIVENILSVTVKEGIDKGRTLVAFKKRTCEDVKKLKDNVFLIHLVNKNDDIILYSKLK